MADVTVRKQRLRTLENEIRQGMEEFYYTGMKLKEIRDDELYKEDGFTTWETYCKDRWEWSAERARQLIVAAEYREKLPAPNTTSENPTNCWKEGSVRELTRLEKRDAAKVAAKVVKAVEQSEKQAARDPEVKPLKLTAATVRKFVDEELSVDRAAQARETKRQREEEQQPLLHQFLIDMTGRIEAETELLEENVSPEAWKQTGEQHPRAVKRLAAAVESLAGLLRRLEG